MPRRSRPEASHLGDGDRPFSPEECRFAAHHKAEFRVIAGANP
jgi:hypothetical protein